jgi:hypothetical protein
MFNTPVCMSQLQTSVKRHERYPYHTGCGNHLLRVLRVLPLGAFKTWWPGGPAKTTLCCTRSHPQRTRCHIPSQKQLPPTKDITVPQMQMQAMQYDSVIPETEADTTSDDLQFRERRTKSRIDVSWEERPNCDDEEVNGRLKRKKGHQRFQPQERDVRITSQDVDVSQKRKIVGASSRRVPPSQGACDFGGDTVEFSTDDDDEGEASEDGFEDTPSFSQFGSRGKESQIDRFLRGSGDEDDRKNANQKKGKKLPAPSRKSISTRTRSSQRPRP